MRTTMLFGAAALAFAMSAPAFAGDKTAKTAEADAAKPAEASAQPASAETASAKPAEAAATPASDAVATTEDAEKEKADEPAATSEPAPQASKTSTQ